VSGRPPKKRLMVVLSGREGNRKSQGPKERQVAAGTIYVGGVLRQKSTGDKDMDYLASPVLALLWDFDGAPDPPAVDDGGGGGGAVVAAVVETTPLLDAFSPVSVSVSVFFAVEAAGA